MIIMRFVDYQYWEFYLNDDIEMILWYPYLCNYQFRVKARLPMLSIILNDLYKIMYRFFYHLSRCDMYIKMTRKSVHKL